ncbi:MAG TPA: hypothetical protein GX400_23285 [Chloroflexi bacterium]|nr:hypothetical protein [Chloroflexota bacterium]
MEATIAGHRLRRDIGCPVTPEAMTYGNDFASNVTWGCVTPEAITYDCEGNGAIMRRR